MKTIYKFPLTLGRQTLVSLEPNAQLLTIQMQERVPTLWVLLDPDAQAASHLHRRTTSIVSYGTGWDMPDNPGRYIATVQDDTYLFHFFEENAA